MHGDDPDPRPPEETYEIIRRRARAAGQSIQTYMRSEIERLAHEPTDSELFAQIEAHVSACGIEVDAATLRADIHAERRRAVRPTRPSPSGHPLIESLA